MLGFIPDRQSAVLEGRAALCESIAMSGSDYIARSEMRRLEHLLESLVERQPDIVSAGVRRADGRLPIDIGGHRENWSEDESERSNSTHVRVPIRSGEEKWGTVELRFQAMQEAGWAGILNNPWVRLATFVTAAAYIVFFIYLGRMLQHLDPSQAVPRRVRAALDSLAEGLLVIDREGRIVLANQAFSDWVRRAPEKMIGVQADSLDWSGERRRTGHGLPPGRVP